MVDSNKSVAELLEELRGERERLDVLIQALEERSGIASTPQRSGSDDDEKRRPLPSTNAVPMGFFHNLSQAAAAEKLLRMNPGQALRTSEILEAFRNSGMDVNSKNAPTILYTALKRSTKFERIGSKAWGLREWYPERKKKISSKESENPREESSE
jgi:hypothetical protein